MEQGGAYADLVASSVLDLSEGGDEAAGDVTGSADVTADAGGDGVSTASVLHSALGIRTRPLDAQARRKVSGGGGGNRAKAPQQDIVCIVYPVLHSVHPAVVREAVFDWTVHGVTTWTSAESNRCRACKKGDQD